MRNGSTAHLAALALYALVPACGGAPAATKGAGAAPGVDIGDVAVAHGGIDALGTVAGGGGASDTAPGTLRASVVDRANPVKLDGVLGEWPARTPARVEVKGPAGNVAFSVALQYDERTLYVAGEVTEESFYRTARFGEGEDHASLVLAFPSAGGLAAYDVGLFAGKPGESAGEVRLLGARRGVVPGSRIVEAPSGKGYTFEAAIPWSTFPESRLVRVGLRAAARYYASDGSATARVILATGPGDVTRPQALAPLLSECEQSIADGLLAEKKLGGESPKADLYVDVAGDAMKERVTVWGSFLTICGPGFRGGKEYFFKDLGGELVHLEARDVTGRGKDDLVIRRRVAVEGAARDWLEVLSVLRDDEPVTTFGQEIAVARDGKRVSDAVRVGTKEIDVSVEPATGWDASSYREPPVSGVDALLLPWGPVRAETFRFDGTRFARSREVPQAPAPGFARSQAGEAAPATQLPARREEPPTPPVVTTRGGDTSSAVFAQYRRDQGVGADVRPRLDLAVNVDGDDRPEHVVLIGRDLVVFGPGFKGGTQYAFLTLSPFESPADIADVSARDLTGDGAADLVVRGTRRVAAAGGVGTVELATLLVYQVRGGSIVRVFAIETGRSQGTKRAQGLVQFVPAKSGKGFDVDVRPGRVTGWTEKSYPWTQDQPGSGALEPLLLPWGGVGSLRYGWTGSSFTRL